MSSVIIVGEFANRTKQWKAALSSGNFDVLECKTGLSALAKLNTSSVDLIICQANAPDLSALQLACLLKANKDTISLPFIVVGEVQAADAAGLPHFLTSSVESLANEDIDRNRDKVLITINDRIATGKTLGWKGKPVSTINFSDSALAQVNARQGLNTLINDLIIERVVARLVRSLTTTLEPRKRFLHSYFDLAKKLTNCDLSGIAMSDVREPWLAMQGKTCLNQSSIGQLISEVKSLMSLAVPPVLETDRDGIDQGTLEIGDRQLLLLTDENGLRTLLLFANSSEKSFSRAQLVAMSCLRNEMQTMIPLWLAQEEIEHSHREQAFNASIDPLTGLYNIQFLLGFLQQQLLFSFRQKLPVGLLLMDIDNFDKVNSGLSLKAGDVVLMKIASQLLATTRASDLCARYGGDEFAIVLPNTDLHGAKVLAEKIRLDVEQISFFEGSDRGGTHLTLSIGCAQFDMIDLNPESILKDAKSALQKAKESGKNRVGV